VLAWALAFLLARSPLGQPEPGVKNVFYRLFGLHEGPFFLLLACFMACAALLLARRRGSKPARSLRPRGVLAAVAGLSVLVVVVSALGYRTVMHSYALSMDEYNAQFQSTIFASGRLTVPVPAPWDAIAPAITPGFVTYQPESHSWLSAYLPVYAGLRAIALRLSMASMLNPLLAGLSILLMAWIARRLWPDWLAAPALAAALLAASSQFVATSMTLYSMPAHLCFNLLWLALYLKSEQSDRCWPGLVLPWIGVLALGLHNPFPHALFVAPFLLRMLRTRRLAQVCYVGGVYLAGSALWLYWLHWSLSSQDQAVALGLFGLPGLVDLLTQVMDFGLILSWQTPVMLLGMGVAFVRVRHLRRVERDLLAGALLTFAFYACFRSTQGHGWGYRYMYGVLGNLVIVSAIGMRLLARRHGTVMAARLVIASLVVTVAVQWPLRAMQIERFIRPFAAASRFIRDGGGAAVVVPTARIWYGSDLIRNGPEFSRPVIVAQSHRNPGDQRRWLEEHVRGGVRMADLELLARLGLVVGAKGSER
jgi:hypothetical protein